MAYVVYQYCREKWVNRGGTTKGHKEVKPRDPCEHELQRSESSLTPLESSTSPEIRRAGETGIDDDSAPQQIAEKSQPADPINYDPSFPCSICKEEKKAARRYRWKLVAGLALPFIVQGLDTTIIAGALPFIASDFRKSPHPIALEP